MIEELGNQLQKAKFKDLGFLIIVREMRGSWTGSTDSNIIHRMTRLPSAAPVSFASEPIEVTIF